MTHLHVRSWCSCLAGASSPEALVRRASGLGMRSLALTDLNGVYGAVRFQKACRAAGIKPIIGAEVMLENGPLVLIARSATGYANLCRIITAAQLASREEPCARLDDVARYADDLFCLTGGREGYLHRLVAESVPYQPQRWLARLHEIFSDHLYVELCHYLRPNDAATLDRLHGIASAMSIPVVATGDVRYATTEGYIHYDVLTCIRHGITINDPHPDRPVNAEQYLKSEEQLRKLIRYPEAFENSETIAAACSVDLLPGYVTPPSALVPDGRSCRDHLSALCVETLLARYPEERYEDALTQLRKELEVISDLDLEEFFLTVREVTEEARRRGIRCAGRGSAANSIVAYLLGITGVDPLRHRLLFERFLHGGRKGTPDIDVDFDTERRLEIVAWMEERFGIEQTAMTATRITYRLRLALRDVAKALGWSLDVIERMTEVIRWGERASFVWLYRQPLIEIAGESALLDILMLTVEALDDCPRHIGQHSGGMILSRQPLYRFTPVQLSANGVKVVQFDKDDAEALGLVKLDVLGLRMLSCLSETVELVERSTGETVDIDHIPLDDPATFNLIRSGKTMGVFQIESQGQMHLLAQHQPEDFDDLISEIALFRPGPVQGGMVNPFVRRRRGLEPVRYEHPSLEEILGDTYGVILFQEQVLDVAHRFAGMSLQEADDFRSLMSKYRSAREMEGMRQRFVDGAMARGVDHATADLVFDRVAKFVGYGFCRSHAAAFAMTVYQSAWLKCHYPAAFMAAFLQHRPGMYNQTTLEAEARRLGVRVMFPEINRSAVRYELEPDEKGTLAIRKPLTAVTGLSTDDATRIVLERSRGEFTSVEDLCRRVDLARDVLDNLARSGALDNLSGSSRRGLWEVGVVVQRLASSKRTEESPLFDLPAVTDEDIPQLPSLTDIERLRWDYLAQGSARRHPMTLARRHLSDMEIRPISTAAAFTRSEDRPRSRPLVLTLAGVVILRQMPPTAKGVMFVTIEDESGFIQCIAQPALQERLEDVLRSPALIIRGEVQIVGNWRGLVIVDAWKLGGVIGGYGGYPSAYGGGDRVQLTPEEGEMKEYLQRVVKDRPDRLSSGTERLGHDRSQL